MSEYAFVSISGETYKINTRVNGEFSLIISPRGNIKIKSLDEIRGLENLTHLNSLWVSWFPITKMTNLENLFNLKELKLGYNQITRISGLDALKNLWQLKLDVNKISKIEGLDNLENLTHLDLSDNDISKIEGLDHLHQLKVLDLGGNGIKKIEGIAHLKELEVLNLACQRDDISDHESKACRMCSSEITDLSGLKGLKNLKSLFLSGHYNLNTLEGIENFPNLEWLSIEYTQVYSLKPLLKLTRLKNLYIEETSADVIYDDFDEFKERFPRIFIDTDSR